MLYRIYIPALEPDGVSMTIDCEAANWMLALRYGLDEIGADREIIKRAICDIKTDKTIHVMEPAQGRVFVLRELPPHEQATSEQMDVVRAPLEARPPRKPRHTLEGPPGRRAAKARFEANTVPIAEFTTVPNIPAQPGIDPIPEALPMAESAPAPGRGEAPVAEALPVAETGPLRRVTSEIPAWANSPDAPQTVPSMPAVAASPDVTTSAPSLEELNYPLNEADLEKYFDPEPTAKRPQRTISHLDLDAIRAEDPRVVSREPSSELSTSLRAQLKEAEKASEELFASVFEEMSEIDFVAETVEEALQYSLELAVKRIPSEAGWLLLADMNRRDLYFATATGPKAEQVINYRLPMGKGIAGFCAVNGVSLSLSDVENDPRFHTTISKSVGYEIRSVACAPVQHEGRVFGALQIMNHQRRAEYTPGELDVVEYIAKRTAEYLSSRVDVAW